MSQNIVESRRQAETVQHPLRMGVAAVGEDELAGPAGGR